MALRWLTLAFLALFLAKRLGNAAAPMLVAERPLLLLALSASDLHCALTAPAVRLFPWLFVAASRRLLADPLFFYAGWTHEAEAIAWLGRWFPQAAQKISTSEASIRRVSYAAVALNAGAVVCCLAGIARMRPSSFAALNISGTVARLLAIRALAATFPGQLDYILGTVRRYQYCFIILSVVISIAGAWRLLRTSRVSAKS